MCRWRGPSSCACWLRLLHLLRLARPAFCLVLRSVLCCRTVTCLGLLHPRCPLRCRLRCRLSSAAARQQALQSLRQRARACWRGCLSCRAPAPRCLLLACCPLATVARLAQPCRSSAAARLTASVCILRLQLSAVGHLQPLARAPPRTWPRLLLLLLLLLLPPTIRCIACCCLLALGAAAPLPPA